MENIVQQFETYFINDYTTVKKITEIVLEIGNRLREPNKVNTILAQENNRTIINGQSISGLSSFFDYPALCILFGELDAHFPKGEWDRVAYQYMLRIQDDINTKPLGGLALFGGASGLGMAGLALSRGGTRYSNFITNMNEFIMSSCEKSLIRMQQRLGGKVAMGDYDVISGMAGVGRYLLFFKDQPRMKKALMDSLTYLIALTADIEVNGHKVPGWYIPVEEQFLPADKEKYPHGNFNVGVAHGISSVLAILSLALLHKIEVPGQKIAINKIVNWLGQFTIKVPGKIGGYWPSHISWEEQIAGSIIDSTYDRDGWCYGTPGVGRAVYLAGCALQDASLKKLAIEAFDAVFAKSKEEWRLIAPTFCHGLAGLLHLTQAMFLDTGLPRFATYRQQVLVSLLEKYQSDIPFGFYELEWQESELKSLNRAGLINGTAGSVLALLGLIKPIKSNWDTMFLIR